MIRSARILILLFCMNFMASSLHRTCSAADIIDVEDMVNPSSFGGTIQYVSANGMAVTGTIGNSGFRWTSTKGVETFTDSNRLSGRPEIKGITDDGTKIYIQSIQTYPVSGYWMSGLSDVVLNVRQQSVNSEYVRGVSGNSWFGSVLVTPTGRERASVDGGSLGFLPGAQFGSSIAYGRGGVGDANISDSSTVRHAFARLGGNAVDLGVLPGGTNSRAYSSNAVDSLASVSSVIVGFSESSNGGRAFRWTSATGMQDLGSGTATAVSADGYWIFGESNGNAFIWDTVNGMRNLRDVLISNGVTGIESWSSLGSVDTVYGNVATGYTLTGIGSNGRYIVRDLFALTVVPEPSSIALATIACGAMSFMVYRRKNRRF